MSAYPATVSRDVKRAKRLSKAAAGAASSAPQMGKRGRKPPPENESDRQRFIRIGNARMVNALQTIALLENLSRGAYEWSLSDIEVMEMRLIEQARRTADEFRRVHEEKMARAQKQELKKRKPDFSFAETEAKGGNSGGDRPTFK